ncbi:MAG TPA: cell division protein ZapA [candidate division Zixibacteria bacterium]
MSTPPKSIHVNIFGEEYPLRSNGDTDVEYMTKVAAYVDQSMRKIASGAPHLTTGKVAILAALNITDELLSARRQTDHEVGALNGRARSLADWLEGQLSAGSTSRIKSHLS